MGSEWKRIQIAQVAEIDPEVISAKSPPAFIDYIDISSVGEGQISTNPIHIKFSEAPGRARRILRSGDTVLSTVRPNRRSMFFASSPGKHWVASTGFAVLRPKTELIEPRFLYACVFNQVFTAYLISREKGAAYPAVSPADISNATIPLPPLPEQRAIAHILGTLDDKIELNRRMNQTLEEMARALFRSWFVDFDPVRAKAEGRETGLPEEIAALFPDEFEDSELGEIPKGWKIGEIKNIANVLRDSEKPLDHPEKTYQHYSIPAFDEGQWPKTESGTDIKSQKYKVLPGTVLLSKLNPEIERVWLVDIYPGDRAVCSTEFLVLQPHGPYNRAFVYCLFRVPECRQKIQGLVTGTSKSHQRAQVDSILSLTTVMPPAQIVENFEKITEGILMRALASRRESRTLASIRDTLLPKLLSGELRIEDAEKFAEASGA